MPQENQLSELRKCRLSEKLFFFLYISAVRYQLSCFINLVGASMLPAILLSLTLFISDWVGAPQVHGSVTSGRNLI